MAANWQRWLTAWCIAVGIFGLVLAGGAFSATDGPVRALTAQLNPEADLAMSDTLRFTLALMGAVSIGWALTLYAAIGAAVRLGSAGTPVWRLLVLSVTAWFVIDSSLSIATGFGLNAVSNSLFLGAFIWPVWRSGVLRGRPIAAAI